MASNKEQKYQLFFVFLISFVESMLLYFMLIRYLIRYLMAIRAMDT